MNNSRYGSVCLRPRFLLPGLVVAAGLAVWLSASVFAQVPWAPPGARATAWAPGVQGGVPFRPTVCATLAAPAGDAAATINAALSACPAGQVVRLGAGTFTINNEIVFLRKGVTLRGAGLGADGKHLTVLKRTNGAQPGTYVPGPRPDPVVIMGSSRWTSAGTSANVSADAAKGATSVIVASGTYQPGQIVLVDELSGADWRTDPQGRGQVWASADFSVVWQRHNPGQGTDDPWPAANAWFSRADRPQAETHQVASFDAATGRLTFTTPLHKAFRASQAAQVYSYATQDAAVRGAGLEDVRVEGGGDGNVRMEGCVECWVARTENTTWLGEGVAVNRSFRCEVRDSYIHDGVWSVPGGGGYALSIGMGSAEVLVENNVIRKANKVMVARSSGAGSVVGYNYVDDGFIQGSEGWMEVGLNASHMVGPHHVLFEGNHGFNFDSDKTHGNSTYMTVFRNQLTGKRSGFADSGPKRAAGAAAYGYNMTYAGNVLGVPGMTGWAYESGNFNTPAIWLFGWDDWSPYPNDPGVKTSALREGNFDYATNSVRWDGTPTTLPSSLYLGAKPAFFGASTWPWVDSLGATKVYTLPAKARYDSGRPNVAPPSGPNPTPTPSPTATPSPTPTPPPPPPTPTPTPSPTPSPTSTPTPTPTPSPSPTPTPSPTPSPSPSPSPLLPADRSTVWAPGVRGIPVRSTICANVNATTFGNGTADASTGIQNAINACPANQVVQLSPGVFKVNTRFLQIAKGITLRGSGPLQTILRKTNGATPGSSQAPDQQPLVIVGPSRWPAPDNSTSRNLTVDGAKGGFAVTVSSGTGFAPGQFVLLDEDHYNTAAWTSLPPRNGQLVRRRIWASDRAVWMRHKPAAPEDDPFPEANGWFSRPGRPIAEIKEVSSVSGNTVTFTTPLHISYRTSKAAQLTRYTGTSVHVKSAGVEDLSVEGGSDGGVRFEAAAYSWARNIGNTTWLGDAVAVNDSFRVEVRDSYIHDAAFPNPGGFAFALSLAQGSSEVLVENNIVVQANKMMVARSAGAGSVVGYNYMDDGFIATDESWVEVGINGSHMVGAHHMLFEGNESFNYDSDDTHGNSIYHTVFRNRLTGFRSTYPGQAGARAAGLMYGSWWHSFVGNVLGKAGSMQGWVYEDLNAPWGGAAVWKLGYAPQHWEQDADAKVVSTVLRDGNFDYLTNVLHWASTPKALPNSLYLAGKPAFFGALTWPWVTPEGTQKLFTLPAKSRFVSGNPYGSPSELAPLSEE